MLHLEESQTYVNLIIPSSSATSGSSSILSIKSLKYVSLFELFPIKRYTKSYEKMKMKELKIKCL
jgi:hypothetical protein